MTLLQSNAEVAVREMLREIARKTQARTGSTQLYAEDFMDDGSKIALSIDIDQSEVVVQASRVYIKCTHIVYKAGCKVFSLCIVCRAVPFSTSAALALKSTATRTRREP